jgi:hypothetical protein
VSPAVYGNETRCANPTTRSNCWQDGPMPGARNFAKSRYTNGVDWAVVLNTAEFATDARSSNFDDLLGDISVWLNKG